MTALIRENQGLVHFVAKRFATTVPLEDLVQEGNLALLRAASTFNPAKGKWLTYAYGWVRAYVGRAADRSGLVKKFQRRGHKYVPASIESLDAPMFDDSDTTLLDTLESSAAPADEQLERHQLRQQVRDVLGRVQFSGLAGAIVHRRLLPETPVTLDMLGQEFGVSKERVRQVELRVRAKLGRLLAPLQAEAAHV